VAELKLAFATAAASAGQNFDVCVLAS